MKDEQKIQQDFSSISSRPALANGLYQWEVD